MGDNEEDDPTLEDVHDLIDTLSPGTLALLGSELEGTGSRRVHRVVTDLIYDSRTAPHVREAKLREYLFLIDHSANEDVDLNLALIEGLHCVELLEQHRDMSQGDDEHRLKCKALIKVTRAAVALPEERGVRVHDQEGVVFLTEPHLIKLVLRHPDRAEQIADFISERRDLHADVIEGMLENTPPLAPGTL